MLTRLRIRLIAVLASTATLAAALTLMSSAQAAGEPLPWLKTSGNRIVVASSGQDVVLRGANVLRSEWDNRMDAERRGIPILANEWKGNVILRGFASGPVNAGNPHYLSMLDEHVSLATAHRMYVIFAWRAHTINGPQPTMPDHAAQQALTALAKRYHGKSNVIYALQVEPHDVTWSQVQPRFVEMVDSIRTAAAPHKPIVMVPGIAWSRDLSGAITNPVPRDNIVYKSHPYNDQRDFQKLFVDTYLAGKPVFLGEFGYLPEHHMHMDDVTALLSLADKHRLGWTAWIFDHQGPPVLTIDNFRFLPTAPYGVAVQQAMRSTQPVPRESAPTSTSTTTTTKINSPTPPQAGTVNNDHTGSNHLQFEYRGSWQSASGSTTKFNGDDHYSGTAGDTATFRFTGTGLTMYGSKAPWHGRAAVSVNGGPETVINYYSANRRDNVPVFRVRSWIPGDHVVRIRVTGQADPASLGTVISVDRAVISP